MTTLIHRGPLRPGRGDFVIPAGTTRIFFHPDGAGGVNVALRLDRTSATHMRFTRLINYENYPQEGNGVFELSMWLDSAVRAYTHVHGNGYRSGNEDYYSRDPNDTHYGEDEPNYWGEPTASNAITLKIPAGNTIAPPRNYSTGYPDKPVVAIETMTFQINYSAGIYPYVGQPWRMDIFPAVSGFEVSAQVAAPTRGAAVVTLGSTPATALRAPHGARTIYAVAR